MKIQQIRNATIKLNYGNKTFLVDPWLQDKGTGFAAKTVNDNMKGKKTPLNDLPMGVEEILTDVDYCILTHLHPDHFTKDYLPKDMKFIVQNKEDLETLKNIGFDNIISFDNNLLNIDNIEIIKTKGMHGENLNVANMMGIVSGYIFKGENKSIYIAGDTIFYDEVEKTLNDFNPEVIVLNCCEATMPIGRLIMNLKDVKKVSEKCPASLVIASHLDSVNHALINSDDVRAFIQKENIKNVVVPSNGQIIADDNVK